MDKRRRSFLEAPPLCGAFVSLNILLSKALLQQTHRQEIAVNKTTQTLENYIRARYPIIVILSHEESRVMGEIKALSASKTRRNS